MELIKYIKRQDSGLKLSAGNSGETSLNLSTEIFDFISKGLIPSGTKDEITFKIYKEDFIKAICFIIPQLPLYKSSSKDYTKVNDKIKLFYDLSNEVQTMFDSHENVDYKVTLFHREDGRFYMSGLRVNTFSIRDFLVENNSALSFQDSADGFSIRILSDIREGEQNQDSTSQEEPIPHSSHPLPQINSSYAALLTALHTKPFVLLAGISGTGKSRIVRELAKACWPQGSEQRTAPKPCNYEMVQVRPNWHDSSELLGYVSRIGGEPQFVAGDFLKFVVRAWKSLEIPHFLCLDEMNLAPVEQYFAEYLSVIETRKLNDGKIVTDPLLKRPFEKNYDEPQNYNAPKDWYQRLIFELTGDLALRQKFLKDGIAIPQNLFVVGTVNMDETTFSFSRKVLDRAMTIEMNEVDLHGGLGEDYENKFGIVENLIPQAVEGKDVYNDNKALCDKVIAYLEAVNAALEKTPFKIAYRTRNEFLVYAVARGAEKLTVAIDEMTSMKILSRIEGDSERTKTPLEALEKIVNEQIVANIIEPDDGSEKLKSISAEKIAEMKKKLESSGYTSFWS